MARSYARIITAIWRNPTFRALDPMSQWLYILLVTQPDISAVGMLPLTLRRWASLAADCPPETVQTALDRLSARRFVAVDVATEEVLVRSFVRWDGGFTNRKRLPVIRRGALDVASAELRSVLRFELDRLDVEVDGLSDRASDGLSDALSDPEEPPLTHSADTAESSSEFPQVDRLSDRASHAVSDAPYLFEGVVGGYVSGKGPQPTTHNPPPSEGEPSSPTIGQRANAITKVYVDLVPLSRFPAIAQTVRKALTAGYDDALVSAALERMAQDRRSVTVDSLRVELDGPARPRPTARGSATDANIAEFLGAGSNGHTPVLRLAGGSR